MSIQLDSLLNNEALLLQYIAITTSIGGIISNLEWLVLAKHFKIGGLFSWPVRKVRANQITGNKISSTLDFLFSYPMILTLFLFKIFLCVFLVFSLNSFKLFAIICLLQVALSIVISIRGNEGTNGADQMNTISLLAIGLCLLSQSSFVWGVGLAFLALQLTLAYSTSGWIRIFQPTWRNGKDLLVVLRQHTYGNKIIWKFGKDNMWFIKYSSLSILIFECASLFVLFMPIEVILVFVCFGVLFHFINAIVIGLNGFIWSFIPLLIAYYWVGYKLNNILWT